MKKNSIEMTLRAIVDGKRFAKIRLPAPMELTRNEAELIAVWARPFSGTCLTDLEIHVSDIKPSNAMMVLSDLSSAIAKRIKPMLMEARLYGFGLRVMRETTNDPYELSIYRRCVDIPQLTITARSLSVFLAALGYTSIREEFGLNENHEARVDINTFAERLRTRYTQCMESGVAHYREYSQRIVEYGLANGASQIAWGPERRGTVAGELQEGADLETDQAATLEVRQAAANDTHYPDSEAA